MPFEPIVFEDKHILETLSKSENTLQLISSIASLMSSNTEFAKKCEGITEFTSKFATKEMSKRTLTRSLDNIIVNDQLKFAHMILSLQGEKFNKEDFFGFAEYSVAPTIWNSIYNKKLNVVSDYLDFVADPLDKNDFYKTAKFYHKYTGSTGQLEDSTTAAYAVSNGNYYQIEDVLNSHNDKTNKTDLLSKRIEQELNLPYRKHSYLVILATKEPELLNSIMIKSKSLLNATDLKKDFKILSGDTVASFKTIVSSKYFSSSPASLQNLWQKSSSGIKKDYRNISAFNIAMYKMKIRNTNSTTVGARINNTRQNKAPIIRTKNIIRYLTSTRNNNR